MKRFLSSASFSLFHFLLVFLLFSCFPFASYFSRSSTMGVFPTMGSHILTSCASIIYSLALLSEIHFPVLDKCRKSGSSSYYVWKQSNSSTWSITVLQNIVYAAHFFVAWSNSSLKRIRNEYHHFLYYLFHLNAFYCKYPCAEHNILWQNIFLLSMASQT